MVKLRANYKTSSRITDKNYGHYKNFTITITAYRIAQNVGGGKHWRIWRLSIDSPKFSHPNIINTFKCNRKPTQFAKVLPSNYTSRMISPKFHPANILRYTVLRYAMLNFFGPYQTISNSSAPQPRCG